MFIPVVLIDGHEELVSNDELRSLMCNKQVMSFKRSDGWVVLGQDKMRDLKVPYNGVERRQYNGEERRQQNVFSLVDHWL